jgi:hypothetical protein
MVRIGFGVASSALIPGCFYDACDEDSESLIEQTDEFVHVAVEGCREYRRPVHAQARHGVAQRSVDAGRVRVARRRLRKCRA